MNTHDDLSVEWANIDGEGLIRVFPTEGFKQGVALLAHVQKAGEEAGYYPQVTLTDQKVIVTIPPQNEGLDHRLAHAIDDSVDDAAKS